MGSGFQKVLKRDVETYERKAAKYARAAKGYNTAVKDYNTAVGAYNAAGGAYDSSFYKDASGNMAGLVNGQWTSNVKNNNSRIGYALWKDPKTGQELLRKPDSFTEDKVEFKSDGWGPGQMAMTAVIVNGKKILRADSYEVRKLANQIGIVETAPFQFRQGVFAAAPTPPVKPAEPPTAPAAPPSFTQAQARAMGGAFGGSSQLRSASRDDANKDAQPVLNPGDIVRANNAGLDPRTLDAATARNLADIENKAMIKGFDAAKLKRS